MTERIHDIGIRTFEFALRIVKVCQALDRTSGVARTLSRQLLRSGTSVGANLREARYGQSRADFITKCTIALKECHETGYWLALIVESGIMPHERLRSLMQECEEVTAILVTIVKNAKSRPTQ
jgi:four helix bundle protein